MGKIIDELIKKATNERALLHLFHGFFCVLVTTIPYILVRDYGILAISISLGYFWFKGFLAYEVLENQRLKDGADLDILGFLMAYVPAVILCIILYCIFPNGL